MGEIKRFNHGVCEYPGGTFSEMNQEADGDYVLHSDHEAEVARLRAELEKVRGYEVAPLEAKVAELLAEVEMLRKDAERYRWLRDTPWFDNYEIRSVIAHQQNALWDKTIDAAMGASA